MSACRSLFLLAALAVALSSCGSLEMAHPDVTPVIPPGTTPVTGGGSKVTGAWTFAGVTMKSVASSSMDGMKAVMTTNYTSTNNSGDFIFDGKNMSVTNLSYTMAGTIQTVMSVAGAPVNDVTVPLDVTMPPYNATVPYKQTSDNTIYMEKGFIQDPSGVGSIATNGGENKISWSGDTLILTMDLGQINVPGTQISGTEFMKLVKK